METKNCACIALNPIECFQLRYYGYYPALGDGVEPTEIEGCECPCHDKWDDEE